MCKDPEEWNLQGSTLGACQACLTRVGDQLGQVLGCQLVLMPGIFILFRLSVFFSNQRRSLALQQETSTMVGCIL